eukprot:g43501.t1
MLNSSIASSDVPQRKTTMISSEDKIRDKTDRVPFIVQYFPGAEKLCRVLCSIQHVINDDEELAKIIPTPPLLVLKQPANLKQTIMRSKLPSLQDNIDHNTTQPCQGNLCKTCQIIRPEYVGTSPATSWSNTLLSGYPGIYGILMLAPSYKAYVHHHCCLEVLVERGAQVGVPLPQDQQWRLTPDQASLVRGCHLGFFEDGTTNIDNGDPVDVVQLDFQKAFDKVLHKRLICE